MTVDIAKLGLSEAIQQPNPLLVHKYYRDGLRPQILRIALLLDVFTHLGRGAQTVYEVAAGCNLDETASRLLLDCLCAFGFLEKPGDVYQLTPTSRTFFVSDQASYVGNWVLEQTNPAIFLKMLEALHTGEPFYPNMPWHELAWLESYDPSRVDESLIMWKKTGIDIDRQMDIRICDLACGCGIASFAYANRNNNALVTCVDTAKVLEVAQSLAERMGISSQVSYKAQDLNTIQFTNNSYDIVLLGNITNFFTPEQDKDLFRRIYDALKKEGQIVINVTMAPEGRINEHTNLYSLILWSITGTYFYNYETYKAWLNDVGFGEIKLLSNLWISAKKG